MKKLIILSGIPGSGKSYFSKCVKEIKCNHVYIISSDAIRKDMLGSQRNLSKENVVWDIFYNLPKIYSLDDECLVILDATHIKKELRLRVRNDLKDYFDEIDLISFYLPKDIAAKQNKEREYPVPDYVLDSFFNEFELPDDEEKSIFNHVYVIHNAEIDKIITDIISDSHQ